MRLVHQFLTGQQWEASDSLFDLCNSNPMHGLERCAVSFDGKAFILRRELQQVAVNGTEAFIPMRPILNKLREDLLATRPIEAQATFLFPPTAIGG